MARAARFLRSMVALLVGAASLSAMAKPASADPIEIRGRLVRQDGTPIAGHRLRVVVGAEADARAPSAGATVSTAVDGGFSRRVDAPVKERRVTLDNGFVRHKARHVAVGVELELLGRPALYWIELDLVRAGTVGGMQVFLKGASGRFDQALVHHAREYAWSLPDDPQGMRMTGIGAELRHHDMSGSPESGWTIELVIEKHEFTLR